MKNKLIWNILFVLFSALNHAEAQCIIGDCISGFGEKIYPDKGRFVGEFEKSQKKDGKYFYPNGDLYIGKFVNNQRSGLANYIYSNGEEFRGTFLQDKKVYGKYNYKSGDIYIGTFADGSPDGYGTLYYKNGKKWEGTFENGKRISGIEINLSADSVRMDSVKYSVDKSVVAPRVFAVVVGISDYHGIANDLKYSDDDASIFYNHLKLAMPNEFKNGKSVLLLNHAATRNNIENALRNVFSMANQNDFIIFYFSGHGAPGSFSPTDAENTSLSHSFVKEVFQKSKAKYKLCIADACFSGGLNVNMATDQDLINSIQNLQDSRIAVIMSSKPNQVSSENPFMQQGLFSYYLMKGLIGSADLNKDSYITVSELFQYTRSNVSRRSGGKQIPMIFGTKLDRIPLTRLKYR